MNKPELIEGNVFVDDRGELSFLNDFSWLTNVKRYYIVENHEKGFIRAWHGHKKEKKYVQVISGCAMICAVKLDLLENCKNKFYEIDDYSKFILSEKKPSILSIPEGYANGFMTLKENTKIIFFSTSTLEESKNDDYRYDWDIIYPWNIKYR